MEIKIESSPELDFVQRLNFIISVPFTKEALQDLHAEYGDTGMWEKVAEWCTPTPEQVRAAWESRNG